MAGGKREGAGRPKGAKNKRTQEREEAVAKVAEALGAELGFDGDGLSCDDVRGAWVNDGYIHLRTGRRLMRDFGSHCLGD